MTFYRCIVFDYDNTVSDSFPDAQHLAMNHACEKLGVETYSRDELIRIDRNGTIGDDFRKRHPDMYDEFGDLFFDYLTANPPAAYEGMKDLMEGYRSMRGIICIVSNSTSEFIRKGMESNGLPKADIVYGCDSGEMYRKPNTTSLYEISLGFGLRPDEILVVDDKPPGLEMARSFGAASCISGWGIIEDEQKDAMKKAFPESMYSDDVKEFASKVLSG